MQRLKRSLLFEKLEDRRTLAVSAMDDAYSLPKNGELHIGYEKSGYQSLIDVETFELGGVAQIETSNRFGLMFVRSSDGKSIKVINLKTQLVVSSQAPRSTFVDISLTPDERFLFAGESGIGVRSPNKGIVHRFDCSTFTWESLWPPAGSIKIEAVSENRVLLLGDYRLGDPLGLYDFDIPSRTMTELSHSVHSKVGDIEYQPSSGMVFFGESRSSSGQIYVYRIVADHLLPIQSTGLYGSARAGGSLEGGTFLSSDGASLFYGGLQVEADDVSNNLFLHTEPIIAASSAVAFGINGRYFDSRDGKLLGTIEFPVGEIHVSASGRDVWIAEKVSNRIHRFLLSTQKQGVLANDVTDRMKKVSVRLDTNPVNGTVTLNADGSFSYRPKKDYVGSDNFRYVLTDESGATSRATVRITISTLVAQNQAPTAPDLEFHVDRDSRLRITRETGAFNVGTRLLDEFPAGGNVRQMEYSSTTGLLAVRNFATKVRIIDSKTRGVVSERSAFNVFTDMDLTPDGLYLVVADYNFEYSRNAGAILPQPQTTFVHVYDMVNNVWTAYESNSEHCRIEAVSATKVFTASCYGPVSVFLNRLSMPDRKVVELSQVLVHYRGDFEYDNQSGRLYHTNSESVYTLQTINNNLYLANTVEIDSLANNDLRSATLSTDGKRIYSGRLQVDAANVERPPRKLRQDIYAASSELAFGKNEIYDVSGAYIGKTDFTSDVHFVSDDSRHWWTFDPETDRLQHYSLDGVRVGLLATAQDVDGDALKLEVLAQPSNGSLTILDSKGSVEYVPRFGFVGTDIFRYRVSDERQKSEVRTVTIRVENPSPVGKPPKTMDDRYAVDIGNTLSVGIRDSGVPPVRKIRDFVSQNADDSLVSVSERYGVIAIGSAPGVQIFDLKSKELIGSLITMAYVVKIDMTPDDRFLFVSERSGSNAHQAYPLRLGTNQIHRFDVVSREWISKVSPQNTSGNFEAIARNRILYLQREWDQDAVLYEFPEDNQTPLLELARESNGGSSNLLAYDWRSSRLYSGVWYGGSMTSFQIGGNALDKLVATRLDPLQDYNQHTRGQSHTLSSDGSFFYLGGFQVNVSNSAAKPFPLRAFPERILAATQELAVGANGFYDALDSRLVQSLPEPAISAFSSPSGSSVWLGKGQSWQQWQAIIPTGVLENDSDIDGDVLRAEVLEAPKHGVLHLSPNGSFTYTPRLGFAGTDTFVYLALATEFESRPTTVTILVQGTWHNPLNSFDVNADGYVSPLDVLVVINALNRQVGNFGLTIGPMVYLDVNDDENVSPIDVLLVINHLNSRARTGVKGNAEGEAVDQYFCDFNNFDGEYQFSDFTAKPIVQKKLVRSFRKNLEMTYGETWK
ncbi:MAG: tandem-95 repeat protein [Planctomycetota bacterium]|nr:tandem-95 repeat protein [Planctomycetota bacterium]